MLFWLMKLLGREATSKPVKGIHFLKKCPGKALMVLSRFSPGVNLESVLI